MKILLIGSGGREHSIAYSLSKSDSTSKLYAIGNNPGIGSIAELVGLDISNHNDIYNFCKIHGIELVVIGPEQPLADGLSDYLRVRNINVFGPSKFAAQLETSKDFAKSIMFKGEIPTAAYRTFSLSQFDEAHQYIDLQALPIVIKADGLAAGKGVIIAENHYDAHNAITSIFNGEFGDAGKKIVIEEYMFGEEASVFAICDGNKYVILPSAQDHKRIFDNDKGKNTGGMGAYSPAPIVTNDILQKVKTKIVEPLLQTMLKEGHPFVGCLYCGLMIDKSEPKVVEFNVRFGDPETQVVLPLIEGDFAKLLYSASIGNIDEKSISILNDKFATCVVLASNGYPDKFEKGFEINGIEEAEQNAFVFFAGVKSDGNKLLTNGGRVLGITAIGNNLEESIEKSYFACSKINFENKYNRTDIGKKGLAYNK